MSAVVSYYYNTLSGTSGTVGTLSCYWITSSNVALGPLRHTDGNTTITVTNTTTSNWVQKHVDLSQIPNNAVANISTSSGNNVISFNSVPSSYQGYYSANLTITGGVNDLIRNTTATAALIQSTGDFTVELWHYPYGVSPQVIMDNRTTSATGPNVAIFTSSTGYYNVFVSGATLMTSNVAASINTWQHIAYVRQSGIGRLYRNGVLVAAANDATNYQDQTFVLGNSSQSTYNVSAYFSNFRYVKGTAVYSGNSFIVPSAPLSAISGTQILTCTDNILNDYSGNNYQIYGYKSTGGPALLSSKHPFTIGPIQTAYGAVLNNNYYGTAYTGQNVYTGTTNTQIYFKNTVIATTCSIADSSATAAALTISGTISGYIQVGMYINGPNLAPNTHKIVSGSGASWVIGPPLGQANSLSLTYIVATNYILNQAIASGPITASLASSQTGASNFGNIEGTTGRFAWYWAPATAATSGLAIDNVNVYLESQNIAFNFDTNANGFLTSTYNPASGNVIALLNGTGAAGTTNTTVSTGNVANQWSRITASGGLVAASNTTVMWSNIFVYSASNVNVLFSPSMSLYGTPFTGLRDANQCIWLGQINASSTTTVSVTIGMQAWTSSPAFTLLGTPAQLPRGITLNSGGTLTGTIDTNSLNPGLNRFLFSALVTYTMTDPSPSSGGTLTTGTTQQAFIYDVLYDNGQSIQDTYDGAVATNSNTYVSLAARGVQFGTTTQDNFSIEGLSDPSATQQSPASNSNVYITSINVAISEGNSNTGTSAATITMQSLNASAAFYGITIQDTVTVEGMTDYNTTSQRNFAANSAIYINNVNITGNFGNVDASGSTLKSVGINAMRTPIIVIG